MTICHTGQSFSKLIFIYLIIILKSTFNNIKADDYWEIKKLKNKNHGLFTIYHEYKK